MTALLPLGAFALNLAVEGSRGAALVDRGNTIGSYELVGVDLSAARADIGPVRSDELLRALAAFPDGSLRGLVGRTRLVTLDSASGESSTEIPLSREFSNVLMPLGEGRVFVDGPPRILDLSDLGMQGIDGGEGSQYETVSMDRSRRFAIVTFDESFEANFIDLVEHRVAASFSTHEKNARITAAALHPDESIAVLGSDHGRVTLVSTDATQPPRILAKLPGMITALEWVNGGCIAVTEKCLALVSRDGACQKAAHHAGASARIAVSSDESYAAVAGDAGRLEIWSLAELSCTAWIELDSAATSIVFHGSRIVAANASGGFHSFELQSFP